MGHPSSPTLSPGGFARWKLGIWRETGNSILPLKPTDHPRGRPDAALHRTWSETAMGHDSYTLAWILPYVREALKQTSNFEYRTYANALFFQLEKAQVQGVARFPLGSYWGGQTFQYEAMPAELREVASEAFFHLFHKGFPSLRLPMPVKIDRPCTCLELLSGGSYGFKAESAARGRS